MRHSSLNRVLKAQHSISVILFFAILIAALPADADSLHHETSIELGFEAHALTMNSTSLLNPDRRFFDENRRQHLYLRMRNRMSIHKNVAITVSFFAEDVGDNLRRWEADRNEGNYVNVILKEASASFMVTKALFVDVGKIDIKSGVAFFRNPAELVSNPLHLPRTGRTSNNASIQSDPYREGSLMLKADYYTRGGTFTVAFIPKLTAPSGKPEITEQNILERVNSRSVGLLKWRRSSRGDLNPEIVLLIGSRLGVGAAVSAEKNSIIFNLEGSLKNHAPVFVPSREAEINIRTFSFPTTPAEEFLFKRDSQTFYFEATAGLNFRSFKRKYNIIAEYYYNQAGLSTTEWREYFSFLNLLNDYGKRISDLYNHGIGAFAEKNRILACDNVLSGRHYLLTRQEKEKLFFRDLSIRLNYMISLNDWSGLVDVQAEYQLSGSGWKLHTGYWTTVGGTTTEFGVQMVRSGIYAGVAYLW